MFKMKILIQAQVQVQVNIPQINFPNKLDDMVSELVHFGPVDYILLYLNPLIKWIFITCTYCGTV